MTTQRFNLKVIQESYIESHTDNLDKELHKRVLNNSEGTMKVIIEQPEEFTELFNRGEELSVDFMQVQTKLNGS